MAQYPQALWSFSTRGGIRALVRQSATSTWTPTRSCISRGYGKESAALLLKRDVVSLGIDTLSLDHGPSTDFPTHVVMLGANKYLIENMANLDALPPTGATVVIGVLPVQDGTQAQARVLALLP